MSSSRERVVTTYTSDSPETSDQVLLVHGYSGAYDLVDKQVATYLRSLETLRPPEATLRRLV